MITIIAVHPFDVQAGDAFVGMAHRVIGRIQQHNARWYFHDDAGHLIRTCGIGARVQVMRDACGDYCDPHGMTRPTINN